MILYCNERTKGEIFVPTKVSNNTRENNLDMSAVVDVSSPSSLVPPLTTLPIDSTTSTDNTFSDISSSVPLQQLPNSSTLDDIVNELDPMDPTLVIPMPAQTQQQHIVLPSEMKHKKRTNLFSIMMNKNKQNNKSNTTDQQPIVEEKKISVWKQLKHMMKRSREICIGRVPQKIYDLKAEDQAQVRIFIIDLVYAFLSFGMAVFRIDYHVSMICSFYGVPCYLDATANGFLISFADEYDQQHVDTRFIKIKSSGIDLSKICMLGDVADEVASNRITITEAQKKVKAIVAKKPIYSHPIFTYFAYTVSSVAGSIILMYAQWPEIVAALIIGLFVSTVTVLTPRVFPQLSQIHQVVCCTGSGVIALALKAIYSKFGIPFNSTISVFSGVFLLLPGLSLTIAFSEMSRRQWRSGLIRLVAALTASAQLAAGFMIISVIERPIPFPDIPWKQFDYPVWAHAVLVPCCACAFMVALKAPQYPLVIFFILLNSYIPLFVTRYVSLALGRLDLATFVGAFSMQIVSKIYGWISRHPPTVVSSCAVLFCVPGSWSVKGINAFWQQDAAHGAEFIFQMASIAIALALGMLLANLIIPLSHKHELRQVRKLLQKWHIHHHDDDNSK
jgi:uncharacterized membrane protein YjjP (DUF1212 family)